MLHWVVYVCNCMLLYWHLHYSCHDVHTDTNKESLSTVITLGRRSFSDSPHIICSACFQTKMEMEIKIQSLFCEMPAGSQRSKAGCSRWWESGFIFPKSCEKLLKVSAFDLSSPVVENYFLYSSHFNQLDFCLEDLMAVFSLLLQR